MLQKRRNLSQKIHSKLKSRVGAGNKRCFYKTPVRKGKSKNVGKLQGLYGMLFLPQQFFWRQSHLWDGGKDFCDRQRPCLKIRWHCWQGLVAQREGLMTTSVCFLSRFMDAVAWIPNPKKRYFGQKKVMFIFIKKLLTLPRVCNADYHDLAARNSCVTKVFSEANHHNELWWYKEQLCELCEQTIFLGEHMTNCVWRKNLCPSWTWHSPSKWSFVLVLRLITPPHLTKRAQRGSRWT